MTTGSFSAAQLSGLTTALADRYRLERELGAGAMGVVHAAFDPDLERRIALKVLRGATATAAALRRNGRTKTASQGPSTQRRGVPVTVASIRSRQVPGDARSTPGGAVIPGPN